MIAMNQGLILNKSECSVESVDFLRDKSIKAMWVINIVSTQLPANQMQSIILRRNRMNNPRKDELHERC